MRHGLAATVALLVFLAGGQVVHAAGSQDLWPNGAPGNRANTEWRTDSYGGGLLVRRTLVKVFLQSGEVLLLGSSAIGQGTSDILVWNPGLVTGLIGGENVSAVPSFSCNSQRTATISAWLLTSREAGVRNITLFGIRFST